MQATITPCPPVASTNQSSSDLLPKEGLVVMQVQQALRETEGTLDLSLKKPRQQEYNHSLQSLHKPPTVALYRPEPPPGAYYHPHAPHPEQGRGAKSPLVYASSPRPQAPITPKMNKVTVPPSHPKLSPKVSGIGTPGHKTGSITHGTPVSTARYEGLLRQMTPPGNPAISGAAANVSDRSGVAVNATSAGQGPPKETGGSITQGTPVHPFAVDKRGAPMYDYHRIRHSPVTGGSNVPPGQGPANQATSPAVSVTHGGGSQYNSYSATARSAPSYTMEQQLSNRQIIMNDYITSQQMHARARSSGGSASAAGETAGKNEPPPPPSTLYYASTPPPPPQTHTQPRQGVIQRHNPQKQIHYPPPPPGLEAFSSLVDVAVQQPSLPVPHPHSHPAASSSGGHEGLGKTMADRLLADRYDNNRAFREQEMRLQEQYGNRMAIQAERLAVAAVAAHHQRDRERERDLVHLREKEEHRLHREKELQQLEHRLAVQHQQREKEIQQQEHRMAQREKDIQQHVEHRLSVQQVREKEIQHEHRLTVHQQREKEIHQQMAAAAAQREKEHQEHRLAVQQQREKEIQQQEQRLAIQQQREKEIHAEHRLVVQRERDLAHLAHQQQQQHQHQHIQQHIQQHRIEAERRHIAQLYRDQQQQQLDRDSSRLLASGFTQSSRLQQSQQSQQQQQQQSSRQSQASNQQQNDSSSTLTAASLIDAIITHQINQSVENASGSGSSTNQPTRAGDRLFQVREHSVSFFV